SSRRRHTRFSRDWSSDVCSSDLVRAARKFPGLNGMDLARLVTTKQVYQWNQGSIWPQRPNVYSKRIANFHVVAYDYGVKRNILRSEERRVGKENKPLIQIL